MLSHKIHSLKGYVTYNASFECAEPIDKINADKVKRVQASVAAHQALSNFLCPWQTFGAFCYQCAVLLSARLYLDIF